jgi:hypothetical protein
MPGFVVHNFHCESCPAGGRARRIAANVAKLPQLLHVKGQRDGDCRAPDPTARARPLPAAVTNWPQLFSLSDWGQSPHAKIFNGQSISPCGRRYFDSPTAVSGTF